MIDFNLIKSFVYQKLNTESSGHDYLHASRVVNNCKLFIDESLTDFNVIIASAWIHDLIDHKLHDKYKASKETLFQLLSDAGFQKTQIEHIWDIINSISYSKGKVPESIEGKIVQDADRLDALGAIGIARTFAYGGKYDRLIYSLDENDTKNSVAHFYDKLFKLPALMNTKKGKELGLQRVEFMEEFLRKLSLEVK